MWMLPVPGALLFVTDLIAISMSNVSGVSFSTSCLVLFVCALLWEVMHSAVVVLRRS